MKTYFVPLLLLGIANAKVLPDYLKPFVCHKSDPEYEKCVLNGFENARPYFLKGIPEMSFPPLDPFELPLMTVNRTLNDLIAIQAVCRNIRVLGGANTVIDGVKADPLSHSGEIRVTIPWNYLEMEYEVTGQLLAIPLRSKGFFRGNFTDTQIHVKGSLETYQKDGVDYFRVQKLNSKITVGDGYIKLISKNPDLQLGADLISSFFNENPRRVMDAVNPIFVETSNELFRVVADQILANLPASEWLPA
ncbi:uncharacterized protein LOC132696795 [Cylas formicarius]|uniref:uncharacterized protein LOC132696795 n=1 Tax=Cylas formicarius TaxID=197179 RepID=UPI0029586F30|nr:uncharacterized protein LOC132696795 [Cylas formicarius]